MALLLFLLFSASLCADVSMFTFQRRINIGNTLGSDLNSPTDITILVNTSSLMYAGKLVDCSHLRFTDGTSYLNYFIESQCIGTHVRIWLTLPTLPAAGSYIMMLYGCIDLGKLPSFGPLAYSGKFYGLTNQATCPGGWTTETMDKNRFLRFSNVSRVSRAYDGIAGMDSHTHGVSGDTGQVMFPTDEAKIQHDLACSGETDKFPRDSHTHPFSASMGTPIPSSLPKYYTLRLCSNRYLDIAPNLILPYNGSLIGSNTRFIAADDRYIMLSNTPGTSDGSDTHYHVAYDFYTEQKNTGHMTGDIWYSSGAQPIGSRSTHKHHFTNLTLSSESNKMDGIQIPLVQFDTGNDTRIWDYLSLASVLPPKGWHYAGVNDLYMSSGATYGTRSSITINIPTHSIDNYGMGGATETRPMCIDADDFVALAWHSHSIPTPVVSTLNPTVWDPNLRDRYELNLVRRNRIYNDFHFLEERNLVYCYGVESLSGACSSHGSCVSHDRCECSVGYYGDKCALYMCFGVMTNSSSVCNGHGNCYAINSCNCTNTWYGSQCSVTTCYGKYSNESGVCNDHGKCIAKDQCRCDDEWTGSLCLEKIGSPAFSVDGSMLSMDYVASLKDLPSSEVSNNDVDVGLHEYFGCSVRIGNSQVLGSSPYCFFTYSRLTNFTSSLSIYLGSGSTITSGKTLQILDSSNNIYSRTIKNPPYPKVPKVSLRQEFHNGPCHTNGTTFLSSFSDNYRDLDFYWTVNDYKTNDLKITSRDQFFRVDDYSGLTPGRTYVVHVKATNFIGGYGVDWVLCYAPAITYSRTSVFEEGSTYGYYSFFGFFVISVLMLLITCFIVVVCCCWNCVQIDIVQDRLIGVGLLFEDMKKARDVNKAREIKRRKTFKAVTAEDLLDYETTYGDMDDTEMEDYKNFANRFSTRPAGGYGQQVFSPPSSVDVDVDSSKEDKSEDEESLEGPSENEKSPKTTESTSGNDLELEQAMTFRRRNSEVVEDSPDVASQDSPIKLGALDVKNIRSPSNVDKVERKLEFKPRRGLPTRPVIRVAGVSSSDESSDSEEEKNKLNKEDPSSWNSFLNKEYQTNDESDSD